MPEIGIVTPPSDSEQFNATVRRKANLMRKSRSPAKSRLLHIGAHDIESDESMRSSRPVGFEAGLRKNAPVNTNSTSCILGPSKRSYTTTTVSDGNTSSATSIRKGMNHLKRHEVSTVNPSNRSSVFRQSAVTSYPHSDKSAVVEEDESSEYLHEGSVEIDKTTRLRYISQAQEGELQFIPALEKSPLADERYSMSKLSVEDNVGKNNKVSSFPSRFTTAATSSLQLKKLQNDKTVPADYSAAPIGTSWDNIIDDDAGMITRSRQENSKTVFFRRDHHEQDYYESVGNNYEAFDVASLSEVLSASDLHYSANSFGGKTCGSSIADVFRRRGKHVRNKHENDSLQDQNEYRTSHESNQLSPATVEENSSNTNPDRNTVEGFGQLSTFSRKVSDNSSDRQSNHSKTRRNELNPMLSSNTESTKPSQITPLTSGFRMKESVESSRHVRQDKEERLMSNTSKNNTGVGPMVKLLESNLNRSPTNVKRHVDWSTSYNKVTGKVSKTGGDKVDLESYGVAKNVKIDSNNFHHRDKKLNRENSANITVLSKGTTAGVHPTTSNNLTETYVRKDDRSTVIPPATSRRTLTQSKQCDIVDLDISPFDVHGGQTRVVPPPANVLVAKSINSLPDVSSVQASSSVRLNHKIDSSTKHSPYCHDEVQEKISSSFNIDTSASLSRIRSSYPVSPSDRNDSVTLSEEVLLKNNDRFSMSPVRIRANNIKGYRGFIDKTKDTPALADYDSDSATSACSELDEYPDQHAVQKNSLAVMRKPNHTLQKPLQKSHVTGKKSTLTHSLSSKAGEESVNVVRIGNSLSAVLTTPEAFHKRITPLDTEDTMTESDVFQEDDIDNSSIHNEQGSVIDAIGISNRQDDLSMYAVDQTQVEAMVRKYRKMSDVLVECGHDPLAEEDAKKAFALFEMRSRIMITDIERGLYRAGGTTVVDDTILTEFYRAIYRIRDAVIVSKAWRDGASPRDAFTASLLTRRTKSYFVRKPLRSIQNIQRSTGSVGVTSINSLSSSKNSTFQWFWVEVRWVDDTDFALLRCPSLGPRLLRGSEIFTIGDCQSILLKLTHERCQQLREELNEAATRQLYAKELMKEEAEFNDLIGVEGMMTDLELRYLEAVEEFKAISKKLVRAEKAFSMVRDRVERLVQKYEHILDRFDNEDSEVPPVLESSASSDHDDDTLSLEGENEKEKLERRAERAELKAEVAAREVLMALAETEKTKQDAEKIRVEKEREISELQTRLDELEMKSVHIAREYEAKMSQKILSKVKKSSSEKTDMGLQLEKAASTTGMDIENIAAKERIKARFRNRNRSADKSDFEVGKEHEANDFTRNSYHQRLEFYERSLRSIQKLPK